MKDYFAPSTYYPVPLQCGHEVWGTDQHIDSSIRKHKESCAYYFDDDEGCETDL